MKLFKKKYEFKAFGVRVVITLSSYRNGYSRGEKKVEDKRKAVMIDPEKQNVEAV
ncbi:MAG: hypothetical protein JXB42_11390 [Deltaproteobacteria bacterium]|nr:hypothetical protein [Deltaproteobacteria bacterium]